MAFTDGYALLVGVGNYQDPNLRAPVTAKDAEALATTLQDGQAAGYPASQVTLLTHDKASKAGVLDALQMLQTRTSPSSTVLVFLAGHGMPAPGDPQTYYFLPYDTRNSGFGLDPSSMIAGQELAEALGKIRAQKTLIIFNTCFSGLMAGSLDIAAPTTPPPAALVEQVLAAGQGRVVISACKPDQRSWYDDHAGHTLFVQALLAGLRGAADISNGKGYIGLFELYDYVYDKVHTGVKQLKPDADQDPVITIHSGVGPFPVALYHGGETRAAADLAPGEGLQAAPSGPAVQTVPAVAAGRDANVAGRDQNQASSGGVANSGQMGHVQTGAGTQWNIGGITSGRNTYVGSTIDESQSGGIRFGGNTRIHGPVAGGNMTIGDMRGAVFGEHNTVDNSTTLQPLDPQVIPKIQEQLDQLLKAAAAGLGSGAVPAETSLAVMNEASAAKRDLDGPEPRQSLTARLQKIGDLLTAGGTVATAVQPLYGVVKGIAGMIGVPLP